MKTLACMLAGTLFLLLGLRMGALQKPGDDFVLGPDDVIEISVPSHSGFQNEKDLNKTVTVLPDGKINYGQIGPIVAAGRTPSALAADIKKSLEMTRDNVVVVVSVKEVRSRRARILGAIKETGSYDIKPGWRLLDLVAVAGGLSAKPTQVAGHIVRDTTMLIQLDVARAVAQPDGDANVPVEPGDLVLLTQQDIHNQVHVMGQVARPGAYDLDDGLNLVSLISEAGGPSDRAALSKAYVLRGEDRIYVNFLPVLLQGKSDEQIAKFKIQPGDVLFIPEITARFGVMGKVSKPGFYPISETEEATVLKALGMAGGQLEDGDLRRAGVIHTVNGKPTVTPLNIEAMLKKGTLGANVALQPNDILYIPPRGRPFNWASILSPITILYYLGLGR